MKKTVSLLLVCLLLASAVFSLAACGKRVPAATYEDPLFGAQTYTFEGRKVTVEDKIAKPGVKFEGEYKIEKDKWGDTLIVMTFEGEGSEKYSGTKLYEEGEEDGKRYIRLDGMKYFERTK